MGNRLRWYRYNCSLSSINSHHCTQVSPTHARVYGFWHQFSFPLLKKISCSSTEHQMINLFTEKYAVEIYYGQYTITKCGLFLVVKLSSEWCRISTRLIGSTCRHCTMPMSVGTAALHPAARAPHRATHQRRVTRPTTPYVSAPRQPTFLPATHGPPAPSAHPLHERPIITARNRSATQVKWREKGRFPPEMK